MNILKNRIAELRKNKKASQDDVAKALGITRQAISLYERGEHEPKLETWKKLASFFDVSVPYLQGIEPNFDLLTSETKDFILNKLDSNYFSSDKGKNRKQIVQLKDAINEYAKYAQLKPAPKEIEKDSADSRYKYWSDNFSFLFSKKHLVNWVNRFNYFTSNQLKHHMRYSSFIMTMTELIESQTITKFQTNIGIYVTDKVGFDLESSFKSFERHLGFSKNINSLEKQFDEYIDSIKKIKSNILKSTKGVNLESYAKKKRIERDIEREYLDLQLYSKDFNDFSKKNLKTISKKYDDIYIYIAILLRKYKLKRKQDVTKIDEYLALSNVTDNFR